MEGYKSSPTIRLAAINLLYKVWGSHPELRLGQLLYCVIKDKDLFTLSDESFLSMLETFQNEHTTNTR